MTGLSEVDERVLVLMPTIKDGERMGNALSSAGLQYVVCVNLGELCREVGCGAGVALLTEEAIEADREGCLLKTLREHPPWSDFPLVVLAREVERPHSVRESMNVVLVERPVRIRSLLSVVRAALRGRRRQYEVRELLAERERVAEARRVERERYRITLASIGDAVIATDATGRVTFLNPVAEALTGWTTAEAFDRPLSEVFRIVNETTRAEVANPALRALASGVIVGLANHTVLISRDGSERPIDDSAAPIRDEAGALSGAVLVFRDITDRKRTEAERERLTDTLGLALSAADLGTWEWNPATDLITLSARAAEIYGLAQGRTYTREWMRGLLHPDHRERAREAAAKAVREKAEYDIEYPVGELVWVAVRGRGVYDAAGNLTRMLGVVQEITKRKQAEESLRESEERYRILVNSTSDVVYRMSADWSEMQPLDGRGLVPSNAEPLCGWLQLNLPSFEHPRVLEAIDRAISTKQTFELEHQVKRSDGTLGWTFSRAVPILDAAGAIVEWFGTARDVTTQKYAQEDLSRVTAESERRRRLYEAVLSGTPDFVYVFSLDHRVVYANDALVQMWGREAEGAIGKTFLELGYEAWHAEMHCREIDQVRTTKAPIRGEVPFNGTHGRRIYDYIFVPVIGADGEVEAVAGTTRDVTDRKAMEDELREADRKKDDFIALLAHELRNPLVPIRNGLQVIRLARGDASAADRARAMMDRQLAHMVRLIDDLLDVSRISRNKMELRRSRVSLADVVGIAIETVRPVIDSENHEMILSLPDAPLYLDADLTRLAQVFSNLLTNSAKYTERGGRIWLTAEQRFHNVIVTVRDTGIGIPADDLDKIFAMFSQVNRSIERSTGGLGIGLALVKGLVEMHGGTVSAASDGLGCGSTFTVCLPLLPEQPQTMVEPNMVESEANSDQRILVVDDNRDSADSLAMMLRLLGNEVRTAYDGLEAIELAEQFRPAVILMDVGMPRLNGLEATRRLRDRVWGKSITIIALTGWGQEADKERSRDAGCDDHLVKPVDVAELEKMLSELNPNKAPFDKMD